MGVGVEGGGGLTPSKFQTGQSEQWMYPMQQNEATPSNYELALSYAIQGNIANV